MLLEVFLRYLVLSEQSETVVESNIESENKSEKSFSELFSSFDNTESNLETSSLCSLDDMNIEIDTSQHHREEEFNDEAFIQSGLDDIKDEIETSKKPLYYCKCGINKNPQLNSITKVIKISTSTQTEHKKIKKVESFQEPKQAECESDNSSEDKVEVLESKRSRIHEHLDIISKCLCYKCHFYLTEYLYERDGKLPSKYYSLINREKEFPNELENILGREFLCYSCYCCPRMEVYDEMKFFRYRFPIELFDNYKNNDSIYLCILTLPDCSWSSLSVETKRINFKYVEVKFKSFQMVDEMLNHDSVIFFLKNDELKINNRTVFFNFKNVKISENKIKKHWRLLVQDTFTRKSSIPTPYIPNYEYNYKLKQYVIQHKEKGSYILTKKFNSEMSFYIKLYICCSFLKNCNFFQNYEKTYLKKIDDIPHYSKQLYLSLYDFLLKTQEPSFENIISNISLYLYDILINILDNLKFYLNTSLNVSTEFNTITKDFICLLEDKDVLKNLKEILKAKKLTNNSKKKKYSIIFNCLNYIWDYLFAEEEEENTNEERKSVRKPLIIRKCEPRKPWLMKLIKQFNF